MKGIKSQVARFILLIIGLLAINSTNARPYRCTATKLNVRATADKSGKVLSQIAQNDTIDVLDIQNGWGMVTIEGDTGYVSMDYLEQVQLAAKESQKDGEPWTDKQKAVFWFSFAIGFVFYAYAIFQVRSGVLVVIRGWLDFALLASPWFVVFIHLYDILFDHLIFGKYVLIALYIIAGLCLIASFALSVWSNLGNPFNIVISLVMKIIVIPIMAFGIFYLIFKILGKTGIDRRSIIIFGILGVLVGGLMSFDED